MQSSTSGLSSPLTARKLLSHIYSLLFCSDLSPFTLPWPSVHHPLKKGGKFASGSSCTVWPAEARLPHAAVGNVLARYLLLKHNCCALCLSLSRATLVPDHSSAQSGGLRA